MPDPQLRASCNHLTTSSSWHCDRLYSYYPPCTDGVTEANNGSLIFSRSHTDSCSSQYAILCLQWLRLWALNERGMGSIPGGESKIPHAGGYGQKFF